MTKGRPVTPGYIAWDNSLLRPLLHGVVANIDPWSFVRKWVHGHRCTGCQHRVACICRQRPRELLRCAWCVPWLMEWGQPEGKQPRLKRTKRAGRKGTKRTRAVAD